MEVVVATLRERGSHLLMPTHFQPIPPLSVPSPASPPPTSPRDASSLSGGGLWTAAKHLKQRPLQTSSDLVRVQPLKPPPQKQPAGVSSEMQGALRRSLSLSSLELKDNPLAKVKSKLLLTTTTTTTTTTTITDA